MACKAWRKPFQLLYPPLPPPSTGKHRLTSMTANTPLTTILLLLPSKTDHVLSPLAIFCSWEGNKTESPHSFIGDCKATAFIHSGAWASHCFDDELRGRWGRDWVSPWILGTLQLIKDMNKDLLVLHLACSLVGWYGREFSRSFLAFWIFLDVGGRVIRVCLSNFCS